MYRLAETSMSAALPAYTDARYGSLLRFQRFDTSTNNVGFLRTKCTAARQRVPAPRQRVPGAFRVWSRGMSLSVFPCYSWGVR